MLIGLHGYPGAGKDTVADLLREQHGYTRIAFADKLREALYALNPVVFIDSDGRGHRVRSVVEAMGWDSAKRRIPEVRELLQRMGTEVGRDLIDANLWVDLALRDVADNVAITDARFPNEFATIRARGGVMVEVVRPGHGAVNDHESEQRRECDYVLQNDGDIDQLRERVAHLLWWATERMHPRNVREVLKEGTA